MSFEPTYDVCICTGFVKKSFYKRVSSFVISILLQRQQVEASIYVVKPIFLFNLIMISRVLAARKSITFCIKLPVVQFT